MIVVYTGDGKGKTSACVGQALRALGNGMSVAFGQFIKKDGVAGEQRILATLEGCAFRAGGLGFCLDARDLAPHREAAAELAQWASRAVCDMLVLDEALYAVNYHIISLEKILALETDCNGNKRHLVLSGRNAPQDLLNRADLVTFMKEGQHPYKIGVPAQKGIEF